MTINSATPEIYLKKFVFKFLGADFIAPKSGHDREIQPCLKPRFRRACRCFEDDSVMYLRYKEKSLKQSL